MKQIFKYPRTQHIQGSRLQPGDEDLAAVAFGEIRERHLVVEEKMDGANSAISCDADGNLLLQSRGHYLTGGAREKHFDLFKSWAYARQQAFAGVLQDRYVLYGEWLYAKHTIYYNALPHYFMEFDILDKTTGAFLDTPSRNELLAGLPFVTSVAVLWEGTLGRKDDLAEMLSDSLFILPGHMEQLREKAEKQGLRADQVLHETDPSLLMEGLYIKVEEGGEVVGRYKFVRASFLTTVLNAQSHWLNRPIIPNDLEEGVDIFG